MYVDLLMQLPMRAFADREKDLDADFEEGVGNDIQDPALVLALEQAKTQLWFATNESELPPASESALIRFAAERWQAMGTLCDLCRLRLHRSRHARGVVVCARHCPCGTPARAADEKDCVAARPRARPSLVAGRGRVRPRGVWILAHRPPMRSGHIGRNGNIFRGARNHDWLLFP